ncbi:hypothetical protein NL533_34860, partial [Klebsiella pneumoniae]|nr:hypothetical protein [Klebsiella pneumoniae]
EIRQPPSVNIPRALYDELRTVALASGIEVDEHAARAVRAYLDDDGHAATVVGFAERARRRHRGALDLLAEPSRSAT